MVLPASQTSWHVDPFNTAPVLHAEQLSGVVSHAVQLTSQGVQTPLTGACVPIVQPVTQVLPCRTKPVGHDVQLVAVVAHVPQEASHYSQINEF